MAGNDNSMLTRQSDIVMESDGNKTGASMLVEQDDANNRRCDNNDCREGTEKHQNNEKMTSGDDEGFSSSSNNEAASMIKPTRKNQITKRITECPEEFDDTMSIHVITRSSYSMSDHMESQSNDQDDSNRQSTDSSTTGEESSTSTDQDRNQDSGADFELIDDFELEEEEIEEEDNIECMTTAAGNDRDRNSDEDEYLMTLCDVLSDSSKKHFCNNMVVIFHAEFERLFNRHFPDQWVLVPYISDFIFTGEVYQGVEISKVRFQCKKCKRCWTSLRGQLNYYFQVGMLCFRLSKQTCTLCNVVTEPMCYPEEICRMIRNIFCEAANTLYPMVNIPPNIRVNPCLRPGNPRPGTARQQNVIVMVGGRRNEACPTQFIDLSGTTPGATSIAYNNNNNNNNTNNNDDDDEDDEDEPEQHQAKVMSCLYDNADDDTDYRAMSLTRTSLPSNNRDDFGNNNHNETTIPAAQRREAH